MTTCISTPLRYNEKRSLISALPVRNSLRTRGQTSTRNARSVLRREPNAPKSAQVATRNAPKGQTEVRVTKDSINHGRNRAQDPAYLKASSADGPRAWKGATTSITRMPNVVSLAQALVSATWARLQQRRQSRWDPALGARANLQPTNQSNPHSHH